MEEFIRVECPECKPISGTYYPVPNAENKFQQRDGPHILVKRTSGKWGINDGNTYTAVARQSTSLPEDSVIWQVQVDGAFRDLCPTVQRCRRPVAESSARDATRAVTVTSGGSQQHHYDYVTPAPSMNRAGTYLHPTASHLSCQRAQSCKIPHI
jgi:hypothetical protein